jgi:hypothetical protein
MGINKGRISHYFQYVQHQFCVGFLVTTMFCFCFVLAIKSLSYICHVFVLVFLVS